MGSTSAQFRDLNHNGTMEPYEDPARPVAERVEDLRGRRTLEEKVGLLFQTMITPGPDGSATEPPKKALTDELPAAERITRLHVNHFNVTEAKSARETAVLRPLAQPTQDAPHAQQDPRQNVRHPNKSGRATAQA